MAVLLNKFEEMSYAEIADVMGRSPAAIKSLLARARNELREQLGLTWPRASAGPKEGPCRPCSAHIRGLRPKISLMRPLSSSMRRILPRAWRAASGRGSPCVPLDMPTLRHQGGAASWSPCASCRAGLLDARPPRRASACPRCTLPIAPTPTCGEDARVPGSLAGLRRGSGPGDLRGVTPRPLPAAEIRANAWLAPSAGRAARGSPAKRIRPATARYLDRAGSPALAAAAAARLQPGRGSGRRPVPPLDLRVRQPLRRIKATDRLAHKAASDRRDAMQQAFAPARSRLEWPNHPACR